jgi:hypothetical protein
MTPREVAAMEFASVLPVLGCAAMGAMMWLMMRGRQHGGEVAQPESGATAEIAALRAEVAQLRTQQPTDTPPRYPPAAANPTR